MVEPYESSDAADYTKDIYDLYDDGVGPPISVDAAANLAGAKMIANALLEVASALYRLGTADACTSKGAIELLAEEVKGIAARL